MPMAEPPPEAAGCPFEALGDVFRDALAKLPPIEQEQVRNIQRNATTMELEFGLDPSGERRKIAALLGIELQVTSIPPAVTSRPRVRCWLLPPSLDRCMHAQAARARRVR